MKSAEFDRAVEPRTQVADHFLFEIRLGVLRQDGNSNPSGYKECTGDS